MKVANELCVGAASMGGKCGSIAGSGNWLAVGGRCSVHHAMVRYDRKNDRFEQNAVTYFVLIPM